MAERTKLWIADKMKELMKTKSIEQIRISEICNLAEIERSTFYYHFKDKYDLVAWIFYNSIANVAITDIQAASEQMQRMKEDVIFYRRAFEDTSQNALWRYMVEYFAGAYTSMVETVLQPKAPDEQLLFSIRLYCYGMIGMAREWFLQDNGIPAEMIVKKMYASMPENLHRVCFP